MSMIEIPFEKRSALYPLIQNHIRQRVIIDAMLDHPYGITITHSETNPQVARCQLGAFKIFAGDPNHPFAEQAITTCPQGLVIAETDAWKIRILDLLGEKCSTYLRTGFSAATLNLDHVNNLSQKIPNGYQIKKMDTKLATKVYTNTAYTTPESLLQNGIGYCACLEEKIASVAVAYTNSQKGIEVQIYTYDAHKQKGLATCTSATLVAHCLQNNLIPHWSAANIISANLAKKLGYTQNDQYEAIVYKPNKN